jgi:hypothetical protein
MTAYRDLVVSAADQNSRPFVFSHGLGQKKTFLCFQGRSGVPQELTFKMFFFSCGAPSAIR